MEISIKYIILKIDKKFLIWLKKFYIKVTKKVKNQILQKMKKLKNKNSVMLKDLIIKMFLKSFMKFKKLNYLKELDFLKLLCINQKI